jgi:hypothetical protein
MRLASPALESRPDLDNPACPAHQALGASAALAVDTQSRHTVLRRLQSFAPGPRGGRGEPAK